MLPSSHDAGLTAEQLARIEQNRQRALEKMRERQARLQQEQKSNGHKDQASAPVIAAPSAGGEMPDRSKFSKTAAAEPSGPPTPLPLKFADFAFVKAPIAKTGSGKGTATAKSTSKSLTPVTVQLDSSTTFCTPLNPALAATFRSIPGARLCTAEGIWRFPLDQYQTWLERLGSARPSGSGLLPKSVLALFSGAAGGEVPQREFNLDCIDQELRTSLYPFQREGIQIALNRRGRILLADDMGLGKSIQALGIAAYYRAEWPLLVLAPASMVASWSEQIRRWLPSVPAEQISVVYDGKGQLGGLVNILSYDLAVRLIPHAHVRFNVIIADECHALKSADSKRSKVLVPIIKAASRAILLSGTPALSRPLELYPQIAAVQPGLFPKFFDFGRRYCAGQQGYFGWDFRGSSNLRELQVVLERTIMIRRIKDAVLSQLPRKLRHQIFLKVARKDLETFKRLAELRTVPEELGDEELEELSRKAEYMALWRRTAEIKLPAITEYLDDLLDAGHKMLLFAHHQSILDALEEHIKGRGVRAVRIDGRTPPAHRQDLCTTFQLEPSVRVAILSITAASTGLTLTAATTVIFAELFFNPGVLLQAEDRAHRIGQCDAVNVHYLLARGTSDDGIWPLILKKLTMLEAVGLGKNDFDAMPKQEHDPAQTRLDGFLLGRKRPRETLDGEEEAGERSSGRGTEKIEVDC